MKSNIEYLREFIKDNDEANEFLDAIEKEISSIKDESSSKDSIIKGQQGALGECPEFETIDCGIGVIEYIQPDNLKLQLLMEDFKDKQEKIIYQKINHE
jgi:hypothetical protein